jgi:hypothetical protein
LHQCQDRVSVSGVTYFSVAIVCAQAAVKVLRVTMRIGREIRTVICVTNAIESIATQPQDSGHRAKIMQGRDGA